VEVALLIHKIADRIGNSKLCPLTDEVELRVGRSRKRSWRRQWLDKDGVETGAIG
jgi:7,8-dihydro-6-hydroxymethylpterin-pyrophosphokinase